MMPTNRELFLADLVRKAIEAPIPDVDTLGKVVGELKATIKAISDESADEWAKDLRAEWGDLDIIYALAADEKRLTITAVEFEDIYQVLGNIRGLLP